MIEQEKIVEVINSISNTNGLEVISRKKNDANVSVRVCISNVLYREFGLSKSSIGRAIQRDHSTVVHHIKQHENYEAHFPAYAGLYKLLKGKFKMNITDEMKQVQRNMELEDKEILLDEVLIAIRNSESPGELIQKLNEIEAKATKYGF
jgi:IS30 family transposase